MSTLKERLEELMLEYDLKTQQQLADFAGVSKGLVGQWFSGQTGLGRKPLLEFEKKTNYSTIWLAGGIGSKYKNMMAALPEKGDVKDIHRPMLWSSNTPLPEDEYVFTPYLKESEMRGGDGSFEIQDYNGFRLPFGKATLKRKSIMPEKVFCCTLTGDSMEPRIAENAAIAIDTGIETIKDGKVYAFQHDDLFRVKYLYRLPGGKVRIHSENPNYPDETVSGEEIRVIGRVFWWGVLD